MSISSNINEKANLIWAIINSQLKKEVNEVEIKKN